MCMEDIRIGRKSYSQEIPVTISSSAPAIMLVEDPHRVSIVLPSFPVRVYLSFKTFSGAAVTFMMQSEQPPVTFNIRDHGQIITRQLWAFAPDADIVTSIFATYLNEK